MPLQYYLVPNHITPDPDDYMAVSINPQSYSLEDVVERMTREGSTITTAEALANFEEVTRPYRDMMSVLTRTKCLSSRCRKPER